MSRLQAPAEAALLAVLGRALGDTRIEVTPDGLIRLAASHGRVVVADVLARPSAAAIVDKWSRLRSHPEIGDAVPVIVVPHLSRSVREAAARDGINWIDLAGNANVEAPPLIVQIEGRRAERVRLGSQVDPFAARSANVVRLLLVHPGRAWRQKELVDRSELSQPRVSKVLSALEDMALVRRNDDGSLVVPAPEALLDAWADAYRYLRNEIVPVHMAGEGMALARSLQERLLSAGVGYWFTGLPAAWAYDHFARFHLVSVFVDADPDSVRRELDLRAAPRDANVHLIAAGGQKLELGEADPEGLHSVHPSQVYLDLLGLPERAAEAAVQLGPLAIAGIAPMQR